VRAKEDPILTASREVEVTAPKVVGWIGCRVAPLGSELGVKQL
jgi:hypothetical protein